MAPHHLSLLRDALAGHTDIRALKALARAAALPLLPEGATPDEVRRHAYAATCLRELRHWAAELLDACTPGSDYTLPPPHRETLQVRRLLATFDSLTPDEQAEFRAELCADLDERVVRRDHP